MKQDFAKKKYAKRRGQKTVQWRWVIILGLVILMASGLGWYLYEKKQAEDKSWFSTYFSQITTWIAERKSHMSQHLVKAKQMVANKTDDADTEIHFEFYTALPNMQMKPVDLQAINDDQAVSKLASPKSFAVKSVVAKKVVTSSAVISADDLEQEISRQLQKH